jgi:hypothetical protein
LGGTAKKHLSKEDIANAPRITLHRTAPMRNDRQPKGMLRRPLKQKDTGYMP